MCLVFRKSQNPELKVAQKNIPIYKLVIKSDLVVSDSYCTLFRDNYVSLNTEYSSILDNPEFSEYGCNVCTVDVDILNKMVMDINDHKVYVSQALHAFTEDCFNNIKLFRDYCNSLYRPRITVLKGYVPIGSLFYENIATGLIAASAMVYTEEVNYKFDYKY